jgi:DivIVA domain-containing protein
MATPEDVEAARFEVTYPGYDQVEVEGYLKRIADDMRALTSELETVRARSERPFLQAGREVGDLLQHAQEVADKLVSDAEADAARIRQGAERAATATRDNAGRDIRRKQKEVEILLSEARAEAARLREQADHHIRLAQAEVTVTRREAHREAKQVRAEAKREAEQIRTQSRRELEETAKHIRKLRAAEAELLQRIDVMRPLASDTGDVTQLPPRA